jgi:hypothetical protein
MASEANQKQIQAAGLSFILGKRISEVPGCSEWHREHLGQEVPDGQIFTQRVALQNSTKEP